LANRYFAELAYKGTYYHGWQLQKNAVSVQELINKALSTVLRESVETTGCGRTDTGVHARQLFAHFDTGRQLEENDLYGVNALLPFDIALKRLIPVHADAHARYDAVSRSYEYHLCFEKDPFKHEFAFYMHQEPDMDIMNKASAFLSGKQDFSCFSKTHTQVKTNICEVTKAEWVKVEKGMVFYISADRFLRNMVRAIVGTLLEIGKGTLPVEAMPEIIAGRNRAAAGASVPACGLYLTRVEYPYIVSA
jgi:tRNA pseudouridine38-40 synthase